MRRCNSKKQFGNSRQVLKCSIENIEVTSKINSLTAFL